MRCPAPLKLGRRHAIDRPHRRRERHERRRHVQVLERPAHGVLAADGPDAQIDLRHERAEHRRHGLAPTLGHVAQLLEVLLERQVHVRTREPRGDELRHALDHGDVRPCERIGLCQIRVEAPRHAACRSSLAEHRQLGRHGKRRGELARSTERHEHRARADGRIEALRQPLVRAHVEVGDKRLHALCQRTALPRALIRATRQHPARLAASARRWTPRTRGSRPRWSARATSCARAPLQ